MTEKRAVLTIKSTAAALLAVMLLCLSACSAFGGAKVLDADMGIDYETLALYLSDSLGGEVSDAYADPLGQDRIAIIE